MPSKILAHSGHSAHSYKYGPEQLLELGEARRRSSVHFDAVSRRLSNVGKDTKRRMSAIRLSAPEKIAERLSKLNKENNAYTHI